MQARFSTTQRGFTLIELMVVVVIIAILSTIATTSLLGAQRSARDSNRKTQVNSLANAIESYYRVNAKFPGQIGGTTPPDGSYLGQVEGCEAFDSTTNGFVYGYFPTSPNSNTIPTKACNNRPALTSGGYTFNPDDYKPYPTWIPGIGDYLNPAPMEKKYIGKSGVSDGVYDVANDPFRSGTSNVMRTYGYRKLTGGYIVYTVLETDNKDAIVAPKTFTDNPKHPNGNQVSVYGSNVYMIRK